MTSSRVPLDRPGIEPGRAAYKAALPTWTARERARVAEGICTPDSGVPFRRFSLRNYRHRVSAQQSERSPRASINRLFGLRRFMVADVRDCSCGSFRQTLGHVETLRRNNKRAIERFPRNRNAPFSSQLPSNEKTREHQSGNLAGLKQQQRGPKARSSADQIQFPARSRKVQVPSGFRPWCRRGIPTAEPRQEKIYLNCCEPQSLAGQIRKRANEKILDELSRGLSRDPRLSTANYFAAISKYPTTPHHRAAKVSEPNCPLTLL
jgi:hypothetical protein